VRRFTRLLNDGFLEYPAPTGLGFLYITVGPLTSTSDATTDGLYKHYTQAVKDNAAAYLATDGELNGPMLESALRTYLEQYARPQPSKKELPT
jgi:uncharacterized protein (TIGR02448 family)